MNRKSRLQDRRSIARKIYDTKQLWNGEEIKAINVARNLLNPKINRNFSDGEILTIVRRVGKQQGIQMHKLVTYNKKLRNSAIRAFCGQCLDTIAIRSMVHISSSWPRTS